MSYKKDRRTRGHEATLVKEHCGLDIRKYPFSQRTMHDWNTLSTDYISTYYLGRRRTIVSLSIS